MDALAGLAANIGLTLFTIVAVGLILYLAYSMVHPERF